MKIIQLNCTSVRNKKHQIEQYLYTNEISVACLFETFLNPGEDFLIKNFHIVRSDRPSHGGGVAIAINKQLKFKTLGISSHTDSIEVCGVEVVTNHGPVVILSYYVPPGRNVTLSDFNRIILDLMFLLFYFVETSMHITCVGEVHLRTQEDKLY